MRTIVRVLICAVLVLIPSVALADAATDEAVLKPYLTSTTVAVMRMDVAKVDADALKAWETEVFKTAKPTPREQTQGAAFFATGHDDLQRMRDTFLKAGGKQVYVIFDLGLLPNDPSVFVVPLEAGANVDQLIDLVLDIRLDAPKAAQSPDHRTYEVIEKKAIVFGDENALKAMKNATPVDRTALLHALDAAGEGVIQAGLEPTPATIQMLQPMGNLPPELGGGDPAKIVGAVKTATIQVTAPPKISLHGVIHCADAQGATAVSELIKAAMKANDEQMNQHLQKNQQGNWFAELLKPIIDGNDVKIDADTASMNTTAVGIPLLGLVKANATARQVVSASNIQQLNVACLEYAEANNGDYPPDLLTALGGNANDNKIILTNPNNPNRHPGYIYIKPTAKPGANTIVIYESNDDSSDRITVGYGDGHVVGITRDEFKKQLAENNGKPH